MSFRGEVGRWIAGLLCLGIVAVPGASLPPEAGQADGPDVRAPGRSGAAEVPARPRLPAIALPPGFRLGLFAPAVAGARFMVQDEAGTVLVSVPREDRILALPDRDRDGVADAVVPLLAGLDLPYGLALAGGDLHVAETGRVRRFRYDHARLAARDPHGTIPGRPGSSAAPEA